MLNLVSSIQDHHLALNSLFQAKQMLKELNRPETSQQLRMHPISSKWISTFKVSVQFVIDNLKTIARPENHADSSRAFMPKPLAAVPQPQTDSTQKLTGAGADRSIHGPNQTTVGGQWVATGSNNNGTKRTASDAGFQTAPDYRERSQLHWATGFNPEMMVPDSRTPLARPSRKWEPRFEVLLRDAQATLHKAEATLRDTLSAKNGASLPSSTSDNDTDGDKRATIDSKASLGPDSNLIGPKGSSCLQPAAALEVAEHIPGRRESSEPPRVFSSTAGFTWYPNRKLQHTSKDPWANPKGLFSFHNSGSCSFDTSNK